MTSLAPTHAPTHAPDAAIAAPWRRGDTRSVRPSLDSRGRLRGLSPEGYPICAGVADLAPDGSWRWQTSRAGGIAATREAAEADTDAALYGWGWAALREFGFPQFMARIEPWSCVWTAGIESIDGAISATLSPHHDREAPAEATRDLMALVLAVFVDGAESGILAPSGAVELLAANLPPCPRVLWSMTERGVIAEIEGGGIVSVLSPSPTERAALVGMLTLQLTTRELVRDVPTNLVDARIVAARVSKAGEA